MVVIGYSGATLQGRSIHYVTPTGVSLIGGGGGGGEGGGGGRGGGGAGR